MEEQVGIMHASLTFSDDLNTFREMFGSKSGRAHSSVKNEAEASSASNTSRPASIMDKLHAQIQSRITATQASCQNSLQFLWTLILVHPRTIADQQQHHVSLLLALPRPPTPEPCRMQPPIR
jgi:hypothetical protein